MSFIQALFYLEHNQEQAIGDKEITALHIHKMYVVESHKLSRPGTSAYFKYKSNQLEHLVGINCFLVTSTCS